MKIINQQIMEIKVDSIITTYYKGIFKVTKIVKRYKTLDPMYVLYEGQEESFNCHYALDEHGNKIEMSPLIYFIKIADTNFKPIKSTKELFCDFAYCEDFKISYLKNYQNLKEQMESLNRFRRFHYLDENPVHLDSLLELVELVNTDKKKFKFVFKGKFYDLNVEIFKKAYHENQHSELEEDLMDGLVNLKWLVNNAI